MTQIKNQFECECFYSPQAKAQIVQWYYYDSEGKLHKGEERTFNSAVTAARKVGYEGN